MGFEVKKINDDIVFKQIITKTIPVEESFQELNTLEREVLQLQGKFLQLEKAIKEKKMQEESDMLAKQMRKLKQARVEWTKLIQPQYDKLEKDIKFHVKADKATTGWHRITDGDVAIVKMNQIMAPLCEKYNLDMTHPLIMKVKRDFEKI